MAEKFAINQERIWGPVNADGSYSHVAESVEDPGTEDGLINRAGVYYYEVTPVAESISALDWDAVRVRITRKVESYKNPRAVPRLLLKLWARFMEDERTVDLSEAIMRLSP